MSSPSSPADAGFVLLDALMATALAAFAGGIVIMISNGMLAQQGTELDRSVALVMSQSLTRQYVVFGDEPSELEDELYRYVVEKAGAVEGTTSLRAMAILANPKTGGAPVRLDFLGPAP
jgi:hypothetical protein